MKTKRYGYAGGRWNSKKYWRMHCESISRGLKAYHARRKQIGLPDIDKSCGIAFYIMIVIVAILYFVLK